MFYKLQRSPRQDEGSSSGEGRSQQDRTEAAKKLEAVPREEAEAQNEKASQTRSGSDSNRSGSNSSNPRSGEEDGKGLVHTDKETFTEESYQRLQEGAKRGGENSHGNANDDTDEKLARGEYPVVQVAESVNTDKETFTKESHDRLVEGARKGGENSHNNTNARENVSNDRNDSSDSRGGERTMSEDAKERQREGGRKGGENSHR